MIDIHNNTITSMFIKDYYYSNVIYEVYYFSIVSHGIILIFLKVWRRRSVPQVSGEVFDVEVLEAVVQTPSSFNSELSLPQIL